MNFSNKKIALIKGGFGVEKDISLITGHSAAQAFTRLKLSFKEFAADENLFEKLKTYRPDAAFLAVHGPYGEDGVLQGILEYLKIPYTGCGVLLSALCMDKILFKKWLSLQKIPTPAFTHLSSEGKALDRPPFFPCVVKPCRSGSSIGVHICKSKKDWKNAVTNAFTIDSNILVEQYIEGVETAVPILNEKILTPVEIQPAFGHFYDFKRKYEKNQTQYFTPPRLKENTISQLKEITSQIQKLFQIKSYGRADFIIDRAENIYVLEFNTLPGLTPLSLLPKSAEHEGISYDEVILKILESAGLDYP